MRKIHFCSHLYMFLEGEVMSLAEKERHVKPKIKHKNLKKELKEYHQEREDTQEVQKYVSK